MISIVNLLEQLWNRPPTKLMRHLCSNVEINARNEQVSFLIHEARDILQTIFRCRRLHAAKKVVGYHDVLRPESMDQLRRGGVASCHVIPSRSQGFTLAASPSQSNICSISRAVRRSKIEEPTSPEVSGA
jgi:hypothetical protein